MKHKIDSNIKEVFLKQWLEDNKRVVITHNNCNDGSGTAGVISHFNTLHHLDMQVVYLNYDDYNINSLLKLCNDAVVYVGDFSFIGEDYAKLETVAKNLVIVDHHESAYNDFIGTLPNTHIDLTKSGAMLTYEFFFGGFEEDNVIPPAIITYIQDRDLYKFEFGVNTKAVHMMLTEQEPNNHELIRRYIVDTMLLDADIRPYIDKVKSYELKCNTRAAEAHKVTIHGIEFYGLNLTTTISDTLAAVNKIHNLPSVSYWIKEDSIQFSLRNNSDVEVNLSELAKHYGGGGHKAASGMTIKFKDLDLEGFFINKNIN